MGMACSTTLYLQNLQCSNLAWEPFLTPDLNSHGLGHFIYHIWITIPPILSFQQPEVEKSVTAIWSWIWIMELFIVRVKWSAKKRKYFFLHWICDLFCRSFYDYYKQNETKRYMRLWQDHFIASFRGENICSCVFVMNKERKFNIKAWTI